MQILVIYSLRILLLLSLVSSWGSQLAAHPISLSSTVVDVHKDHIEADIQIMLEDLVLYHELDADENYVYSATDLCEAAELHSQFVLKYFSILDASGNRLDGQLRELDTEKIGDVGVPQTDLMKKSVNYVISFPLETSQPFLTFTQTFGGPNAALPALMDLMVSQNGVLKERPTQLALGRPHSTKFDWDKPPTTEPTSFRELRRQRDEQVRERLGITTYGGLYSFLYLTRTEVRHEILIPLLTLEQWVSIPRQNPDFLEVDEQVAIAGQIEQFLQTRNPVSVNGVEVQAKLSRLSFFGLDINDFALNAEPRRVSVHQARVGVILTYPCRTVPSDVAMNWTTFSEHAPYVRSIVLVGNDPPTEHYFRVNRPEFHWSGTLPKATIEPIRATSKRLTVEAMMKVLGKLLNNVYGAFDRGDDSEVYDALATSVQGDLLRDIYLRIKRSLVMAEQGGAVSHVNSVTVQSVSRPTGSISPTTNAIWRVSGTVEHWGHVHTRVNEYCATIAVVRDGPYWKLKSLDPTSETRVKLETRIRGSERN